jgi:signal transduction histidine kinase
LGHHLVALGLHLELAAHESQGSAQAAVRTAQTMARAALGDVKAIVRRQNDETPVDLRREMDALARELLQPSLHINYPANVVLADPRVSRALLRAVQEIVTNAIRHGEAHNLWIDIDRRDDRVTLAARDDGHSGAHIVEGFGISGMRRRIEELGGTLSATSMATGGFEVRAELPCANAGAG